MGQKISPTVAPALKELQRLFDAWRSTGRKGQRIPEELWKSAALVAGELGVNPVSRTIGLDYTRLKRRVARSNGVMCPQSKGSHTTTEPAFVELAMKDITLTPECIIEFEGMRGKFTLRLAGHRPADVVALVGPCTVPKHQFRRLQLSISHPALGRGPPSCLAPVREHGQTASPGLGAVL